MDKETFIILMKSKKWELDTMVEEAGTIQFKRGRFILHFYEKDIEHITEDLFDDVFKSRTAHIHFFEDWKDAFVGSEFLIPVVEKEMDVREHMLCQKIVANLAAIKNGLGTVDGMIASFTDAAYPPRPKS